MTIARHLMDGEQIRMVRSVLLAKGTYFILGHNSLFVPSRQEKYIDKKAVSDWPDLDGLVIPRTPGEIARIELKREFPELKRVGWQKPQFGLLDWRWPMMYKQSYRGEIVYTDLVSAYHQIYSRLWLNTAFPRGYGSLDLAPVAYRLAHHKRARNALIGLTRATTVQGIKGGKRLTMKSKNAFLSPPLWAVVQSILNEIAQIAIETGCIYIATDGYLHPMTSEHKHFHRVLDSRGIIYRTHTGEGDIKGWGNYKAGKKQTILYTQGRECFQRPFKSIQLPNNSNPLQTLDWWTFQVPLYRERMELLSDYAT